MGMSKNKRRKIKKYADTEKYYDYLYNLFLDHSRLESVIVRNEEGNPVKGSNGGIKLKNVWRSFFNQIDYSLLRKDRDMLNGFVGYVKRRDPAIAEKVKFEIIKCIDQIRSF